MFGSKIANALLSLVFPFQIPYARSEVHLTELIEGICDKMTGYGESKDSETGRKQFVRYNRRDGLPVTLSNININADVQQALKHAVSIHSAPMPLVYLSGSLLDNQKEIVKWLLDYVMFHFRL